VNSQRPKTMKGSNDLEFACPARDYLNAPGPSSPSTSKKRLTNSIIYTRELKRRRLDTRIGGSSLMSLNSQPLAQYPDFPAIKSKSPRSRAFRTSSLRLSKLHPVCYCLTRLRPSTERVRQLSAKKEKGTGAHYCPQCPKNGRQDLTHLSAM